MKIEKNVPIPKKYPFEEMKVGDSFAVPADVKRITIAVAANRYGKAHKMVFSVRQMPDKTFRCWRIE